jgi:hypothetical protein
MPAALAGVVHKRQTQAQGPLEESPTVFFIADVAYASPETLSPPASYWHSNEP